MLGYNVQAGDFLPYLTFNAKHGYWSRKQDDQVVRMDAAMTGVFDFAKFKCGWVKFQEGQAPDMRLTDYGAPPLPHPEADMPKDYKKTFKLGFKVSVVLPDGLGAHEFASNSVGVVAQVNKILEQYNAAPESKAGKLPVVNCKDIVMFRSGKNENPAPVLEIWPPYRSRNWCRLHQRKPVLRKPSKL